MIDWQRLWPIYWMQNYPTNRVRDGMINREMNNHPITIIDKYTVKIGRLEVWIENWPYAYGRPANPSFPLMPTVKTRKRLRKAANEAIINQLQAIK